ncbi:hypothetical protein O4J55_19800 [Paracoccus sp. PXZ]
MGGKLGADHLGPMGQQPGYGEAAAFARRLDPLRDQLGCRLEAAHPAAGLGLGFLLGHRATIWFIWRAVWTATRPDTRETRLKIA